MSRKGEPPVRYCYNCFWVLPARLKQCHQCGMYLPYRKEIEKEK